MLDICVFTVLDRMNSGGKVVMMPFRKCTLSSEMLSAIVANKHIQGKHVGQM